MTLGLEYTVCCVCGSAKQESLAVGWDYQYFTSDNLYQWVSCSLCKHQYLSPRPDKKSLSQIYPATLINYSSSKQTSMGWKVKKFLEIRSIRQLSTEHLMYSPNSVLDVGCGSGEYLNLLKSEFKDLKDICGTEISEVAAKEAKDKGFEIFIGTIEELNFDQEFDLIFLKQVIEHVHDPRFVIEKLLGFLSKRGIIVLETPLSGSWDQRFFSKFRGATWEGFHIPRHFNVWSEKNFKILVAKAGGEVVKVTRRAKPVHWSLSIQNLYRSYYPNKNPKFGFSTLLLVFFYAIDIAQIFCKKGSDVQYVVRS